MAEAARERRPDLKVLFVTGFAENAAVGHGHLEIGMQVLAKPFVDTALANKAREMIEAKIKPLRQSRCRCAPRW
jgi:hypothetical protein